MTSQVAFNYEKLPWKKKQYKMWVYWVHLSFLFPLKSVVETDWCILEANWTFLGSFHFLIYLRSLFKLPTWKMENGPFSKWEVMFPWTNLAENIVATICQNFSKWQGMGWFNCQNRVLLSRLHWKSLLPSAICLYQTILSSIN